MNFTTHTSESNPFPSPIIFTGGGMMGELMRTYDWHNHPLGNPAYWPKSLLTGVRMMLLSNYPMFIWWSDALYMFHNDAYAPTFVGKHGEVLGAKAREVWADIWEQLGGVIEDILSKGTSFYAEDMLVVPQRKGFKEETYWTFSYSPMPDDIGQVNGIFCACSDVTEKVLSQRWMNTLHELSEATRSWQTVEQVCQHALQVLEGKEADLPFAALYLVDQTGKAAYLKGQTRSKHNFPYLLELPAEDSWPLQQGINALETDVIKQIQEKLESLNPALITSNESRSQADPSYKEAVVLPLATPEKLLGFFVAGISPMLEYNQAYERFHRLLAGQLTSSIQEVAAREWEQLQAQALQAQLESERNKLNSLFEQAPVAITILEGEQYIIGLANPAILGLWARSKEQVVDKPLFEAMPEIRNQGLEELLEEVRTTGKPHIGRELPVEIERYGKRETVYFNFVYHPVWNEKGKIISIAVVATDVSELVVSRQRVEANALKLQATNEELLETKQNLEQLNAQLEARVNNRTRELDLAKQQAEKQRSQIYQLFMQAPAGIALLTGPQLIYQMANQTYYQILGRTSQILGKPGREAFPEGVEQGIWDLLEQVYASGEPYVGKDFPALINMDGSGKLTEQYFDFVFQPVKEEEQQVTGILITALNVTHQVLARKAILEQGAYFREMADKVPFMIWTTGPDGYYTYLNKPWYDYTQQSKEEALGLGRLSAIHPEDFHRSQEVFLTATQQKNPFSLLYRLCRKDGAYRWMLEKGEPKFDQEGNFEGYVGAVIDVHEQQRAEQQLQLSVKAGKVGIWEWDVINDRATYSDLLQEMFGFKAGTLKREFEHAYQVYQQVVHPEDWQWVNEQVEKAFVNREAEFYVEFRVMKPSGEIAWIAERGEVVFEGERPVRMNGTCIDITDRKLAEAARQHLSEQLAAVNEELAAANEELRAANEEIQVSNEELSESNQELVRINQSLDRTNKDLDSFIYVASHDLKAPIINIEGLLKVLERQLSSEMRGQEKVRQLYQLLYSSISRFKETILDLTDIARIGKESEEDVAKIPLIEVLEEVLEDLEPQLKEAEVKLELKVDKLEVRFSRRNLKSLLYNLVSNAIKYRSLERVATVSIHCWQEEEYVVLSVEDNGLGIDMRQEEKIFALFKRLHTHVEGTGIGLYIVKKMVENAGGKIEVKSKIGEGSTFKVYFKRQFFQESK